MTAKTNGLTQKQEAFALAFFECGNAAEAYRQAYDVAPDAKDHWLYVEASQLLDHPEVSRRLDALRAQAERLSIFTREKAMSELEEARTLAHGEGQAGAAVSAVSAKIKLAGFDRAARVELTGKDGGPVKTEGPSSRELARQIAFLLAQGVQAADDDA